MAVVGYVTVSGKRLLRAAGFRTTPHHRVWPKMGGKLNGKSPVVPHDFPSPIGLADLIPRQKSGHHRFDVVHRCPIDRVEALHLKHNSLHAYNLAYGDADAARSVLAALGENTDLRPDRVSARVSDI